MRTIAVFFPVVLLSTAVVWGREPPNKPLNEPLPPAENRRYDYKQSLKKPFKFNDAIPFWDPHGITFVAIDFIRLAPSVPGLKGSIWRSTPNEYKEWEIEFSFKAFGQNQVGGRGLAFWYTEERAIDGPVFGSKDQWKGLGVFMDTSDPANQRNTPVIYGIMNDGSKPFPSDPTANKNSFGGCLRDYKTSPDPVVVRVSYVGGTLRVAADTYSKGKKMIPCFEQKDLSLPVGYYFGVSAEASTDGSPDNHDLFTFEVYEVNPPPKSKKPMRPHEAEMIERGEEAKVNEKDKDVFEEVQKIVEQQETKIKEKTDGPGTLSPGQMAQTIGDTQFRIIESLNNIHNRLESLGAPIQPPESTVKSWEEINRKVNSMASSLKAMEDVVQGLTKHIMQQDGMANNPQDISKVLKEELHSLNVKMEDMDSRQSYQHRMTQTRLVNSTSWMSYVIFLAIIQVICISAYAWYKKRLEANEKKFL